MITPREVQSRNLNIKPYESVIDFTLRSPWTEEMKSKGRKVSLIIPKGMAAETGVLETPSPDQMEILRRIYDSAGWVFTESTKEPYVWVFEYPKKKAP